MKYSYKWLQSHIEDPLPSPEVLKETIIFHAFEVEDVETVGDDTIFDINVLPDRAGDSLSHYGMAREIAGLFDLNFIPSIYTVPEVSGAVAIDIQTKDCLRYKAIRVEGVHVGPSPEWLVQKLEAVGQRSINNVVDATNFILLDMGQPTHAFDADKVQGSIIIREATNETITTLSGEEKILKEGMMVIADEKKLLAIAGVKGGNAAEVNIETKNIILEIASFDAVSVRKTSRSLSLVTDASKRFENNVSPILVESAAAKLAGMIHLLAGGTVTAVGEQYPAPQPERMLSFTLEELQRLLGNTIDDAAIVKVFDRYGYKYLKNDDVYNFEIPYWRQDITGVHDMAEEIGRVIGYDTITAKSLPFTPDIILNEECENIRKIKYYLSQQGYNEVMTYTFRKKGDISIAYGPKDKSALRNNLSDGLKESYEMNRLNAPLLGLQEVKLFEVGTVFSKDSESMHVATADKKGIEEYSIDEFVGKFASEFSDPTFPVMTQPVAPFKPWSPYPFITRDVAVWVGSDSQRESLQQTIQDFAAQHCVRPAILFDTFIKKDPSNPSGQATSIAYRLVFQSYEKTLTDEDVEKVFQPLVTKINSLGMEIR